MATTVHPSTRPRLSREFVAENQRRRLLLGAAKAFAGSNYASATVTDIVRVTGVARNTFYDNFPSKQGVADDLVRTVSPSTSALFNDSPAGSSAGVLAIEIVASHHGGEQLRADSEMKWARGALDALEKLPPVSRRNSDDPLLATLPPGRHGLPEDFIRKNQRERLKSGFATTVLGQGYQGATVERVVAEAAVSRRTFYEHFDGVEQLAAAFVGEFPRTPRIEELGSGIGGLVTEIVAAAYLADSSLDSRRGFAGAVLRELQADLAAVR